MQLEAAHTRGGVTPVVFHLNYEVRIKFEVCQTIRSRLTAFFSANILCCAVTWTFDPLTLNVCCVLAAT